MSIQEKIIKQARAEGNAAYSKVWGQFQRSAGNGSTEILPGLSRAGFVEKYLNEQIGNNSSHTLKSMGIDSANKLSEVIQNFALLQALITQVEVQDKLEEAVLEIANLENYQD